MKKSRYSEEQLPRRCGRSRPARSIPALTRSLGVSEATYYPLAEEYGQVALARSVGCVNSRRKTVSSSSSSPAYRRNMMH